jgi:serine/threonine-protein kinase
VRHPNVVSVTDVVQRDGQLLLVMDYIPGVSLAELLRRALEDGRPLPLPVVSAIGCGILHGLHAAHEATDERGRPLGIVHRDVSPQNVLVGSDGVPRLVDFGVAKAAGRLHTTVSGQVKGKLGYMAPEQLRSQAVDRRADIYAAALVIWETVTLSRPFGDDGDAPLVRVQRDIPTASSVTGGVPAALDEVLRRGLQRAPERRIGSAHQMALELAAVVPPASPTEVAACVAELVDDLLRERASLVAGIEQSASGEVEPVPPSPLTPPPARSWWVPATLLVAVIAAAGGLGLWQWRTRALMLPVTAPRTAPAPAIPASLPAALGDPTAAPASVTPPPLPVRASKRRALTTPPPRALHCTPPFTIGPDGVKQYKVECL